MLLFTSISTGMAELKLVIESFTRTDTPSGLLSVAFSDGDPPPSLGSDRMLKLCLDLRGFYLKSGQFLGTRHDFMPKIFLKKLG